MRTPYVDRVLASPLVKGQQTPFKLRLCAVSELIDPRSDLVLSRASWLLWGIRMLMGIAAVFIAAARPYLLVIAFTWAGAACVMNARRCGRFHCYITGPLYLALGLTSGLIGFGVIELQWRWIAIVFAVGTCVACAPEFVGRRYIRDCSAV